MEPDPNWYDFLVKVVIVLVGGLLGLYLGALALGKV